MASRPSICSIQFSINHVGTCPADKFEGVDAVAGFADHVDVGDAVEDRCESAPYEGLVIGDDHADRAPSNGMLAVLTSRPRRVVGQR
ncbi:MAG: hypothetical protein R2715_06110 [Ilumatobacteraceae bacterium]